MLLLIWLEGRIYLGLLWLTCLDLQLFCSFITQYIQIFLKTRKKIFYNFFTKNQATISQKYGGTTKKSFHNIKGNDFKSPLPPKSILKKQGKRKNKKLHMFWQPATLIKGGRKFVPLSFWLIVAIEIKILSNSHITNTSNLCDLFVCKGGVDLVIATSNCFIF